MEAALDLIHVGGLLRSAIKLIKGIKVTQDQGTFTMAVFSVLTWFKVGGLLDASTLMCMQECCG